MKNIFSRLIIPALLLFSIQVNATNTMVNTLASLSTAFTAARPGDTITIANGTYSWGKISIANTSGTPTSPWIVVRAESRSGVIFKDSTYFMFSGTRILVDGFRFANGNSGANAVMAFRTSSSVFANYSRITNITFDNYNSPEIVENEWVAFYGVNNRLDHCTFINKSNARATVVVWYSNANFPDRSVPTYHRIDSNYFAGRSYMGGNGGETIRVGVGNNSRTFGYNVIEYNLFEGLIQAEPEIVSNKSYYNTYRYNTFLNCNGGLTLRIGRYCNVYGNFFINNDPTKTGSYGIRIIDKGHKVYNNYCEGLIGASGSLTAIRCPIITYNGTYPSSDSLNPAILTGVYMPADSVLIANNTIVNCKGGPGIKLGNYDAGAALNQPVGTVVANNIIKQATGQALYLEPTNTSFSFFAEGNIYDAPAGLGTTNTTGFTNAPLIFGSRSNGILAAPSLVQDASVNSDYYSSIIGNMDAQGQTRSAIFDAGCDELNGAGNVINYPLDSTLVGAGRPLITIQSQSISFAALPVKTYGDADFNPGATSTSGLTVTYTSSNTSVATIINGNIHIVGAGTSIITASQAGNLNYSAATDVSQTLTVNQAIQNISFTAFASKTYGDADFNPGATSTSGLTVTYTSSNTSVATILNGNIHIVGAGTSIITASQAGNQNYFSATDVSQTLTVNQATQNIVFPAMPTKTFGDADFNPGATSTSGLTVTYTSSNTSVATISNGNIHIVGAGTSIITASQSGNQNYSPATDASQLFTVIAISQTITFPAMPVKTVVDADFNPGASASSGLAVSYTSSNQSVATIVNGNIHIVGYGSSLITADQSGNSNYNPALSVSQNLTVNRLAQTISFPALPAKTVGNADFSPGATSTSGMAVSYSSSNLAVATIVGGNIHIVGAGTAVITASQAGNNIYNPATDVSQTMTVSGMSQTISFPALAPKILGDVDYNPGATASSGLTVTYTSSNTAVATILNGLIHIVGSGTTIITASQSGNSVYAAAANVSQNLVVSKTYLYTPISTTVLFGSINSGTYGNLATNNSSYYVVNSTTTSTRKVDWYGTVKITQAPSTVSKITINYDGKNSASKTQILYMYNWVTATWTQIDSRTVTTSDVLVTYTQNSPANFISSLGEIRLRVYSTGGTSNYTCSGDWMQFSILSSSAAKNSGVMETATEESISLYPNPARGLTSISYYLTDDSRVSINVYDSKGVMMKNIVRNENEIQGWHIQTLDISRLNNGIYFINILTDKGTKTKQIIVAH